MKAKTILLMAVVIVIATFLGNSLMRNVGLNDTGAVEEGMTFSAYTELFSAQERLDFCNYSFYANDFGYPVLLRCEEETIVELQVIDTSKISIQKSSFEKLTEGMTLQQVCQKVGVPAGIAKADHQTLIYSVGKELLYLIRYVPEDGILRVQSVTPVTEEDVS